MFQGGILIIKTALTSRIRQKFRNEAYQLSWCNISMKQKFEKLRHFKNWKKQSSNSIFQLNYERFEKRYDAELFA